MFHVKHFRPVINMYTLVGIGGFTSPLAYNLKGTGGELQELILEGGGLWYNLLILLCYRF